MHINNPMLALPIELFRLKTHKEQERIVRFFPIIEVGVRVSNVQLKRRLVNST